MISRYTALLLKDKMSNTTTEKVLTSPLIREILHLVFSLWVGKLGFLKIQKFLLFHAKFTK